MQPAASLHKDGLPERGKTRPEDLPQKRRKPHRVAFVSDFCTGCGGTPVCRVYCKYGALKLVEDPETYPLKRMTVDRDRCIGCGACISGGRDGLLLTGCPWDAIYLVTA